MKILFFSTSLFTCTHEQLTDEDTSEENDDNAELLDEMSQTLENLLRQNKEINGSVSVSNEVFLHFSFSTTNHYLLINLFSARRCYILLELI